MAFPAAAVSFPRFGNSQNGFPSKPHPGRHGGGGKCHQEQRPAAPTRKQEDRQANERAAYRTRERYGPGSKPCTGHRDVGEEGRREQGADRRGSCYHQVLADEGQRPQHEGGQEARTVRLSSRRMGSVSTAAAAAAANSGTARNREPRKRRRESQSDDTTEGGRRLRATPPNTMKATVPATDFSRFQEWQGARRPMGWRTPSPAARMPQAAATDLGRDGINSNNSSTDVG